MLRWQSAITVERKLHSAAAGPGQRKQPGASSKRTCKKCLFFKMVAKLRKSFAPVVSGPSQRPHKNKKFLSFRSNRGVRRDFVFNQADPVKHEHRSLYLVGCERLNFPQQKPVHPNHEQPQSFLLKYRHPSQSPLRN